MNRDAIIATVIGFGIGLVITGIFIIGPNFSKYVQNINLPAFNFTFQKSKTAPAPTPMPPTSLSIEAPLGESIATDDSILVSGVSPTHSTVVIEGPIDEVVVTANGESKYAGKISLVEGKNDIVVTNYLNGKTTSQSVVVFYTPEKF